MQQVQQGQTYHKWFQSCNSISKCPCLCQESFQIEATSQRTQRVLSTMIFMNIRVHSKCSKVPPAGMRSVVLSIPHSERNTPTQQPKWAQKSSFSDTDDLVLPTSQFHISHAHLIMSSSVIGMECCNFSLCVCGIIHVFYLRLVR